jgi:hypothetical protein
MAAERRVAGKRMHRARWAQEAMSGHAFLYIALRGDPALAQFAVILLPLS